MKLASPFLQTLLEFLITFRLITPCVCNICTSYFIIFIINSMTIKSVYTNLTYDILIFISLDKSGFLRRSHVEVFTNHEVNNAVLRLILRDPTANYKHKGFLES